jgi:hypothetical protein
VTSGIRIGVLTALVTGAAIVIGSAVPIDAQVAPVTRDEAPNVFLDCRRCDFAHIRREIPFVNYVRDAGDAHVHVLVSDEQTGGGGRRYTLAFLGRQEFAGVENSLSYATLPTHTAAEEREGLTEILSLGLVPYVARTPFASYLRVVFTEPEEGQPIIMHDPWRNWTFEPYGGGNFNLETAQAVANGRYGIYANRVTEEWKIRLRPYFNHNLRIIRREDREDLRVDLRRHGFDSYVIRSVGPHMGIGLFGDYTTSSIDNLRHHITVTPAIEYNLYPYAEASRRQLTFTYRAGYEFADYVEETIYQKTEENLLNHSLNASAQFLQPWGSISSGLTGFTYLHDFSHHRISFNGNLAFRLGRGVSLNVGGTYQRINDQLSLPRGDASLEDILLDRRRLATSYRGTGHVSLSYTFGSIYTNVVNPRF